MSCVRGREGELRRPTQRLPGGAPAERTVTANSDNRGGYGIPTVLLGQPSLVAWPVIVNLQAIFRVGLPATSMWALVTNDHTPGESMTRMVRRRSLSTHPYSSHLPEAQRPVCAPLCHLAQRLRQRFRRHRLAVYAARCLARIRPTASSASDVVIS